MAIPKVTEEHIRQALDYIDQNGVPEKNRSTKYALVDDNGKRYPPKYVIAVAHYLATGEAINTEAYNAVEAKNYLINKGFNIDMRTEKFELVITQTQITSTDSRFDINNLGLGDNYEAIDAFFKKGDGTIVRRKYAKYERKGTGQTLPKLAFQLYEPEIIALTDEERAAFPVCKYSPDGDMYRGIFDSVEAFKKYKNTLEHLNYHYGTDQMFVIYCWNLFSTLYFVQECLKRFGKPDDSFVLHYREKGDEEEAEEPTEELAEEKAERYTYQNRYTPVVIESKNTIFRGAPGTGKSYLAKAIAADIVSNGTKVKYSDLSAEEQKQIAFVQFHPSYDYSDFVEGLRPIEKNGALGFELRDGIFKEFVDRARKNLENAKKSTAEIEKELSAEDRLYDFLEKYQETAEQLETANGNKFTITAYDEHHVFIHIPGNEVTQTVSIKTDDLRRLVISGQKFEAVKDVRNFFGKTHNTQQHSYEHSICKKIFESEGKAVKTPVKKETIKNYVFIIDEINRGEISKILGELFFSIDPGYRGEEGAVFTQYANLHDDPEEKFYIPENVYIIGTMNDIDRSVDTFDFAMRRRFRFVEIEANSNVAMLEQLGDKRREAIDRMTSLNGAIEEKLNKNYQIGAAYFLKLKNIDFDQLWTDHLEPLLQEYVNGAYDEKEQMKLFYEAYELKNKVGDQDDETV